MGTVITTTRRSNQVFSSPGIRYSFPKAIDGTTINIDSIPGRNFNIFPECAYSDTTCKIFFPTGITFLSNAIINIGGFFTIGPIDPIFRPKIQSKNIMIVIKINITDHIATAAIDATGTIFIFTPAIINIGDIVEINEQTSFYGIDFF